MEGEREGCYSVTKRTDQRVVMEGEKGVTVSLRGPSESSNGERARRMLQIH